MKKISTKFIVYFIITVLLLTVSVVYRVNVSSDETEKVVVDEKLKGKTIVKVWLRTDEVTATREYLVDKFNEEHKDTYIMLSSYKEDYTNLLRVALAAGKGPDIMTYGSNDLIKNKQLISLKETNVDVNNYDSRDFVYLNGEPIGTRMVEDNVKFIWNKEIFQKSGLNPDVPPSTWKQLIDYSKKIKAAFPDIVPFEFPLNSYEDSQISIGLPSVNTGNIYTTFWDYTKGEYNFNYSKNILSVYNELYKSNLLDTDFEKKSRNQLRADLYKGNTAMLISTFGDKGYFSNIMPLPFELGVSDLPKYNEKDTVNYYYINNSEFLGINSSIEEKSEIEKKAISEVYQWFTSSETNKELLKTRMVMSPRVKDTDIKGDLYSEYNKVHNLKTEAYDPTIFVGRNSADTMKLFIGAIKSETPIEKAIESLNSNFVKYSEITNKNGVVDLKTYLEK